MVKKDVIYRDKEYTIVKKDADELGTFIAGDLWSLIFIGLAGLKNWDGGGLQEQALRDIKQSVIEKLNQIT